jgi:CheY-like chemotaxis protein
MRSLNVKSDANAKPWVLLVDDEAFNLEILEELLNDYGYQTDTAVNGREACEILSANPEKYAVILLDRMMPEMGGMEVTEFIKKHPLLKNIPIIMQSAKAAKQDIEDGLGAGILYYLTKPFGKNELLSIVDSAASFYFDYQDLLDQLSQDKQIPELPGSVEVRTFEDAKRSAISLAQLAGDPEKIVMGLYELIINAIEHGNLGIGYALKSQMQNIDIWLQEVENRIDLPENKNKKVRIEYSEEQGELVFKISDEGTGFNYKEFLDISTSRSLNTTGRGIAVARVLCFDGLEYIEPGNKVVVKAVSGT